ncbi:MAG: hypothetical protein ACI8S6_002621, partial [Myxococcota bacterium]
SSSARAADIARRRHGAEGHAALSASIHEVFGNSLMQSALAGFDVDGPGQILQGAMSLGAAGVVLSDSVGGVLSNSTVQGFLGAGSALAVSAKRRAAGDPEDGRWGREAVKTVSTAVSRGGQSLPGPVAQKMGAALGGVDFSGVRIHTDAAAQRAAQAIHAHAFTVGAHVYFDSNNYNPDSAEGQELLAHELTHVRQHIEGRLPSSSSGGDLDVSSPYDSHEVEAVSTASQAVSYLRSDAAEVDAAPVEASAPAVAAAAPAVAGLHRSATAGGVTRRSDFIRQTVAQLGGTEVQAGALYDGALADRDGLVRLHALLAVAIDEAAEPPASAAAILDGAALLARGGASVEATVAGVRAVSEGLGALLPGGVDSAEGLFRQLTTQHLSDPADVIAQLSGGTAMPGIIERMMVAFGHTAEATAPPTPDARASRTDQLVARLSQGLGLSQDAVDVRIDDEATATARGLHTRGVMHGDGEILLDAARYHPETTSGRALLAHEVAHAAQESLPAASASRDPGALAEFEAHRVADRFASGGSVGDVSVGLPEGHVAAEGDISGSALSQLMAEYSALNTERSGGVTAPEAVELAPPGSGATQNRGKKIS